MKLYLVQHGKAKSEAEDPARPLNPEGRRETEIMAAWLGQLGLEVEEIWHSTKLRARETAEILAQKIRVKHGLVEKEGLAPKDDPAPLVKTLENFQGDLLIVGHLPFLSRLASLLVVGTADKEILKFRMSGCVRLVKEENWKIDFVLKPETAPNLS